MNPNSSSPSSDNPSSKRLSLHELHKLGPVVVGEVRGFKSELGKKFDKSDKNAPPIVFGVIKVNLEQVGNGTPLIVSIYPSQGKDIDALVSELSPKLQRGAVVAVLVSKSEFRDGFRKVGSTPDGIHMLNEEDLKKLRAA
jgi:hypothetical protein